MIRVVRGALADQDTEGVVLPIRSDLAPVTPAGRDLIRVAGDVLEQKLEQLGSIPVGAAVMTPSGALQTDFVIHLAVSSHDEPETTMAVQRALRNALGRAADWGLESLSMPPLGLGIGAMEADGPARVMLEILFNHLGEGNEPLDLRVVVASEYEEEVFQRLAAEMAHAAQESD